MTVTQIAFCEEVAYRWSSNPKEGLHLLYSGEWSDLIVKRAVVEMGIKLANVKKYDDGSPRWEVSVFEAELWLKLMQDVVK
jgi:hypothetical protein